MSNLQIYNENSVNLSPISFVNDIQNQLKIRDLDTDSLDFQNRIAVFFTKTVNFLGIKEAILDINKVDIFQMLIMKYKGLSLEELTYAFKLERYGQISPKTQHYQLINAEYVSSVLDKYINWKVSERKNNISTVKIMPTKNKVKEDAIYLLNQKYSGKKASSMDELKSIKSKLKLLEIGQGGEIKAKCKILALEEFFRNLCRDENKLKEFKLKF